MRFVIGAPTPEAIDECARAIDARQPIVLIHPRLTTREREAITKDATRAAEQISTALAIIYTSGSTGTPKGVILDESSFEASAKATIARLELGKRDRWLLALPLAHVGGFSILTRCRTAGASLAAAAPAELPEAIDRTRATIVSLVPTMLHRLLATRWNPPPQLRAMILGGAPASPRLLEQARERRWPVLTTYGLTEACSMVTLQTPGTPPDLSEGAGTLLEGIELRTRDGELELRGPTLFRGYLHQPARDRQSWFATGDLGTIDARGRLFVHGRKSDLIITGGENVHPIEVENALASAPNVGAACVFATPDEEWGQLVSAAIVRADRSIGKAQTRDAVRAYAGERLAPHKRPRRIIILDELPLLANGKVDRARLASNVVRG